jgi:hypothetical protein
MSAAAIEANRYRNNPIPTSPFSSSDNPPSLSQIVRSALSRCCSCFQNNRSLQGRASAPPASEPCVPLKENALRVTEGNKLTKRLDVLGALIALATLVVVILMAAGVLL